VKFGLFAFFVQLSFSTASPYLSSSPWMVVESEISDLKHTPVVQRGACNFSALPPFAMRSHSPTTTTCYRKSAHITGDERGSKCVVMINLSRQKSSSRVAVYSVNFVLSPRFHSLSQTLRRPCSIRRRSLIATVRARYQRDTAKVELF